ncbi:MAG: MFS transporter [Anaerolineae bacterium]|nr:MFS transporter [Anaerolineae bacterium]
MIAKSYYFLYFAAVGCLAPFFNVYLRESGLTGTQIGWLSSIAPLIALVVNPVWGVVADRWQIHRQILALCAFGSGMTTLLFIPFQGFWIFVGLVTIITSLRTPIISIVDSAVMDMVDRTSDSYGQQRIWGTIGFILVSFGLGQVLDTSDLTRIFWLYAGFLGIGCMALSLLLPVERVEKRVGIGQGIRELLRRRDYLSFLIAATLLGMGTSSYVGFLGLYILALGGTEQQVGLGWAANALMEIPIMYFGKRWFERYSHQRLILSALLVYVLVWTFIGLSNTPVLVIISVLGIGICFGTFWMSAVGYVSSVAPPGLSATAQTLMGAALLGLGWSLGSVVAGYLWDINSHMIFFFAALTALLAALIFGTGNRSVR